MGIEALESGLDEISKMSLWASKASWSWELWLLLSNVQTFVQTFMGLLPDVRTFIHVTFLMLPFCSGVSSSSSNIFLSTTNVEHLDSITFLEVWKLQSLRKEFTCSYSCLAWLLVSGPLCVAFGLERACIDEMSSSSLSSNWMLLVCVRSSCEERLVWTWPLRSNTRCWT